VTPDGLLEEFIIRAVSSPSLEVAQGIPVGEDPNLPMDQDQFRDWVNRQRDLKGRSMEDALSPYGGSILELIRRNNMMRGV
jgi:hypothetical protein